MDGCRAFLARFWRSLDSWSLERRLRPANLRGLPMRQMTSTAFIRSAGRRCRLGLTITAAAATALMIAPAGAAAEVISDTTRCKPGNRLPQLRIVTRFKLLDNPERLVVITRYFNNRNTGDTGNFRGG